MVGRRLMGKRGRMLEALLEMQDYPKGTGVLQALKFSRWHRVGDEEMEFMIDLMDALNT
jgi:phosphonate transport system substrate-binding protein